MARINKVDPRRRNDAAISPDQEFERRYFREKLRAENPFIASCLRDDEIDQILSDCFVEIGSRRSRRAMQECAQTKALERAARKAAKA